MFASILGTNIHTTRYRFVVSSVLEWARSNESRSIYAANVHMLMEAYDSKDFQEIVNSADLVTPDGMPLVWLMRAKGFKDQERVYGPTLMLEILEAASREKIPVGFLGSSEEILAKLTKIMSSMFPGIIVGVQIAPPFRALTSEEDREIIQRVNESGTKILFVSLGCPKQECWIADRRGKIHAVMVGVGAAFAFHAGEVRQSPSWMQKLGLEWLYRLFQEPKRLWKRYFLTIPRFILLILGDFLRGKLFSRPG